MSSVNALATIKFMSYTDYIFMKDTSMYSVTDFMAAIKVFRKGSR